METESKKQTGSYYTPTILSDFIAYHLFDKYKFGKNINILEPSIGDGIFFESIFHNKLFKNRFTLPASVSIDAVEKEKKVLVATREKFKGILPNSTKIKFSNEDYLDFHLKNKKKFDLVIGNPPYIKSQHLTRKQISLCEIIHENAGLEKKSIKNIWTSFLIGGVQSLSENGVLCFVLPAELLQVIYAKELRELLRNTFSKIEIFTFNELIFDDIEQDVIVLICAKNREPGVSFFHVERLEDLKEPTYTQDHSNIHRKTLDKWTNYILSDSELQFLDSCKKKLLPIKDYCRAEVGIVTAANDYFIVEKATIKDPALKRLAKPVLQKGSYMPPTLNFNKSDFQKLADDGKPAFFLAFENKKESAFPASVKRYLKKGEALEINDRYKCQLRENWYFVPSVWTSEGFFTKRSNVFPRMVVNEANVIVTDAFYRIRMKEGYKIQDLVFSFYNTLTFIFAELEGRYYGGSVLELTPNEYKNLSIPYKRSVPVTALNKLDKLLRSTTNIREILEFTDEIILKDTLKLTKTDIQKLREIYIKLVRRRLKKLKLKF